MGKPYTVAEQIRSIRRVIREIESGAKSATISSPAGQRSYTNHDLETLYKREADLLKRLNASSVRKRVYPDYGDTD
jgi:hypothetical protein